jgi:hypothetical protein
LEILNEKLSEQENLIRDTSTPRTQEKLETKLQIFKETEVKEFLSFSVNRAELFSS